MFVIESMNYNIDVMVEFEKSKLKAIFGEGGKEDGE